MAYNFNGSSQYLSASAPLTAQPLTLAAWVYDSSAGVSSCAVDLGTSTGANNNQYSLEFDASRNAVLQLISSTTASYPTTVSTAGFSASTYAQLAGTCTSATSRTVYLNGGSSAATTQNCAPQAAQRLLIGAHFRDQSNVFEYYLNGRAAEIAIWSVDLSADEINSLAKGFSPRRIRPQSLVFYAPLIRNLQDTSRGGRTLTNNNTATVADHPRVY